MKINLHIERLVLDGLSLEPGHEKFLQTTVESELLSLIRDQGLVGHILAGGAQPSLATNGIQLDRGYSSLQLGRQIAQSVYGGLRK
jgi:hypothetical protein